MTLASCDVAVHTISRMNTKWKSRGVAVEVSGIETVSGWLLPPN